MNSIIECFKKYAVFSGRATRSEYWIFWLFAQTLINSPWVMGVIIMTLGGAEQNDVAMAIGAIFVIISGLLSLGLVLPSLAVAVRRLHDIGEKGTYLFIGIIPFVGPIILLVALCQDSQRGGNQYGISEKYPTL